jgi:DNA-binding transcriptional MerR regulator
VEEPWTILELAELAAETLGASDPAGSDADAGLPAEARTPSGSAASGLTRPGSARANGRVRDVPNERLVRWYVTVGLVDPPLSRRGRVARYGRRHLLQLVAVKRRQAEGRSLAEIQAELAGATDETLAAVARVPETLPPPDAPAAEPGRFWARQPGQAKRTDADGPGQSDAGGIVRGVRLAPGVTLLLEGADREPGPDDVAEIISAARPLLEELASRRLYADYLE